MNPPPSPPAAQWIFEIGPAASSPSRSSRAGHMRRWAGRSPPIPRLPVALLAAPPRGTRLPRREPDLCKAVGRSPRQVGGRGKPARSIGFVSCAFLSFRPATRRAQVGRRTLAGCIQHRRSAPLAAYPDLLPTKGRRANDRCRRQATASCTRRRPVASPGCVPAWKEVMPEQLRSGLGGPSRTPGP
jgi:hypothetical protein